MAGVLAAARKHREGRILVASPRGELRKHILHRLPKFLGHAVEASGGADTLMKLASSEYGTLVLDSQLEDLDAEELVVTLRTRYPHLQVVVLDRKPDSEHLAAGFARSLHADADGLGNGDSAACDSPVAATAATVWGDSSGVTVNASDNLAADPDLLPGMIGRSPQLRLVCRLAELVAPRDTPRLVTGATGTGKELVARGIHALSPRAPAPFAVVNCAAITETLLEAELFGFTRGAFTGAFQSRAGRIHAANGGTLLLDEVGELPLSMQAKLLRFVQEGEVQRLGSTETLRVDVRLIAATNTDLLERVRQKRFREDLYYRLAVFPVELPPLRAREADILLLAQHFLEALCDQDSVPRKSFSVEAVRLLNEHLWPGNIGELRHVVERASVLSESRLQIRGEDLTMLAAGN